MGRKLADATNACRIRSTRGEVFFFFRLAVRYFAAFFFLWPEAAGELEDAGVCTTARREDDSRTAPSAKSTNKRREFTTTT
jgi:hypothetical protein